MIKLGLLILITFLMSFEICEHAFAQALTTESEEETLDIPRSRKFIYLTLGVEYDEKVKVMPEVITFKGDFRNATNVSYIKSTKSLHFIPKKEGLGVLTILNKSGKRIAEYRIVVRKNKLDTVARELQSLLGDVEGITIRILNGKVIIDGQVLLPSDMGRVLTVVNQFQSDAVSLVTMSPLALKKIADFISREINNPQIIVSALNDKIVLTGWAESEEEKASAGTIAQLYMPPVVLDSEEAAKKIQKRKTAGNAVDGVYNMIKVKQQQPPPPSKMVQVVLHYVELSKDYSKAFRFQFMPDIDDGSGIQFSGGDGGSNGATSQFTATIKSLFPKLNWLTTHGNARVLESGTILVKEGEQAKFNSTIDYPKNQVTGNSIYTSTGGEHLGIDTTVKPTLTGERSDSIDLDMDFKMTTPAGTTANGIITASNSLKTQLVVRSTQSAAVGGLISNKTSTSYNKLPASAPPNPIISLYTSKDFVRGQTQFVVFVTPIIRSSASVGAEKIKKKFRLRE